MSSVNYIQDGTGNTYIPATQRPDGSWRRPIRVREGYVPQEEQPLYVSKGKDKSPYPVGLSAADFVPTSQNNVKGSPHYFEIGNYEPVTKIPGLNFVKENEEKKITSKKKKKSKKSNNDGSESEVGNDPKGAGIASATHVSITTLCNNKLEQTPSATSQTDPVKRLRNLRKKLKDIEALELKIGSRELLHPEKDQLEKIQRKDEVLQEIDGLNVLIASLGLNV